MNWAYMERTCIRREECMLGPVGIQPTHLPWAQGAGAGVTLLRTVPGQKVSGLVPAFLVTIPHRKRRQLTWIISGIGTLNPTLHMGRA